MATVERAGPRGSRSRCAPRRSARRSSAPPSERPDEVALRTPRRRASRSPGASTRERVERIAAGLAALGVERGDTVALMLLNRPEFHLVDTAALHLGATPFSVYNTSTAEQIEYLFANAGNRVVVTEQALPAGDRRGAPARPGDRARDRASTATSTGR